MQIVTSPKEFSSVCRAWRAQGHTLALAPTMGYLHAGHLSLFTWARANAAKVAATIFVNPTQFGPGEDLDRYPRDPEGDAAKARQAGVDLLYMPQARDMYPQGFATTVSVAGLTSGLCGRSRPGHFDGVATVVTKLLVQALPDVAVFGRKDWQQLAVIRRLAADLDLPVAIEGRPIFREPDGLAMSSRNALLPPEERAQAPHVRKGLLLAHEMVAAGERSPRKVVGAVEDYYRSAMPLARTDYVECVHPETIQPVGDASGPALLAVAVKFPGARLIDNALLAGEEDQS
ncbi:Pantothenate synthetase [Fundidesulfovibrio magnetotacticus]|uniref:Pantothenate synthetase n=1 Tax=Fundidesulfovibrio magnetotacticus TaxID=2730080 RepID=A0A6V8LUI5_9BACT|nr:pantoate--beta-alanine ligase [Fundidesulfovibrio magnetotacticus]GFK95394.1 Pantothenate synthetase [Fundidesulfovibrio magnetotacticus]